MCSLETFFVFSLHERTPPSYSPDKFLANIMYRYGIRRDLPLAVPQPGTSLKYALLTFGQCPAPLRRC